MKKIDTLYTEWQSFQPLKEVDRNRLNQKFMLEFNYNSNHIEGNTLTYGQTEMLLLFGKSIDDANMKDLEEMKAHNVGLKMIQTELENCLKILKSGTIRKWWYNGEEINFKNKNTEKIISLLYDDSTVTVRALSESIGINKSAVQKQIKTLQNKEYIKRIGGTKGKWIVMLFCTTPKGGTNRNDNTI